MDTYDPSITAFMEKTGLDNPENVSHDLDKFNPCIKNSIFMCHKPDDKLYDCNWCSVLKINKMQDLTLSVDEGRAVATLIRYIEPQMVSERSTEQIEIYLMNRFSLSKEELRKYYDRLDIVRPDLSLRY